MPRDIFVQDRRWPAAGGEAKPTVVMSLLALVTLLSEQPAMIAPEDVPGLVALVCRHAIAHPATDAAVAADWAAACDAAALARERADAGVAG